MWLHIQNNDKKFIIGIKELYESIAPGENTYAIIDRLGDEIPAGSILVENTKDFKSLLESRTDWTGIIFNPLDPKCWKWLKHIPEYIPVVWYRWGYEAYKTHSYLRKNYLYLPETKRIVYQMNHSSSAIEWLRGIWNMARGRYKPLQRVDVLVGPEREEYDLYRDVGLLTEKTVWKFGMTATLDSFCEGLDESSPGKDIKVGNSADPTNNHLEAFRLLSKFDLTGRKVITPLSYGSHRYRDIVLRQGEKILGEHFEPLIDFMPLKKYNNVLIRCGFIVMNHLRQQAGANIMADLWRGGKVYMNETTAYKSSKSWGLSVDLISEQSEKTFFTPKSTERIDKDRSILQDKIGRMSIHDKTHELLEYCNSLALSTSSTKRRR